MAPLEAVQCSVTTGPTGGLKSHTGASLLKVKLPGGAAFTVNGSTLDAVCWGLLLSRTVTVTLNVPATVGVPKGAPVVELIDIPLGNPLADQLYGIWPPVAITAEFAAYPIPTVAVGGLNTVLVIVSAGATS